MPRLDEWIGPLPDVVVGVRVRGLSTDETDRFVPQLPVSALFLRQDNTSSDGVGVGGEVKMTN